MGRKLEMALFWLSFVLMLKWTDFTCLRPSPLRIWVMIARSVRLTIILTRPAGEIANAIIKPTKETVTNASSGFSSEDFSERSPRVMLFMKLRRKLRPPMRPVVVRMVRKIEPDSLKREFQSEGLRFK